MTPSAPFSNDACKPPKFSISLAAKNQPASADAQPALRTLQRGIDLCEHVEDAGKLVGGDAAVPYSDDGLLAIGRIRLAQGGDVSGPAIH